MAPEIDKASKGFKTAWNKLAAMAAWLMLIIGSFFLPPPVGAMQFGGGKLSSFGKFIVALFVGLVLVPVSRYGAKRYTWRWWKTGILAVVLAVIFYFTYQWFSTRWTSYYAQKQVVFGSEFMPGRADWTRTNGVYTTRPEWIKAHAGEIEEIWTKESIDRRCFVLSAVYILALPFFVLAIICVLQTLYCNSRKS